MPAMIRAAMLAVCALAVAVLAAAPVQAHKKRGGPSGSGLGVVVAHQDADTFVVANRGGQLRTVDATTPPAVGSVVKVKARKGVAKRIRVIGTATKARVKGTVTASAADRFSVAGKPDADAVVEIAFAAPVTQPAIGRKVHVTVAIDGTTLRAERVKVKGRASTELEGVVTAYDPAARKLTVTPESSSPIVVAVPVSVDDTGFTVGAKLELKVLLLADGTHVLVRAEADDDDDDDRGGRRGHDDEGKRGRGHDDDRKGRGRGHRD